MGGFRGSMFRGTRKARGRVLEGLNVEAGGSGDRVSSWKMGPQQGRP